MPTIKGISGPYRFFSQLDCNEPMHVHVERERMSCKFWLSPVVLASNTGFSARELGRIRAMVVEYQAKIRGAWNEHCT